MVSIKEQIYYCLEITKATKVPFLLISNPGYGKTTSIEEYAKDNNYFLQTLIGSQFSPEDILGFQVNEPGRETLIQKDPKWFSNIIAAEASGKPSILFIDEISTCSDVVQGSLLSLIFSRKIGNGKKLPEDCLVISAANYYNNLSSFFNILTPTLNRFCVINLTEDYNNFDIIKQFLTKEEKFSAPILAKQKDISNAFYKLVKEFLVTYGSSSSPAGFINLNNTEVSEVYKKSGFVHNIMTGRTLHYLKVITNTLTGFANLPPKIVKKIVGGLIGAGSNNFDQNQETKFIDNFSKELFVLIIHNQDRTVSELKLETDDISLEITNFIGSFDGTSPTEQRRREDAISKLIISKYKDWEKFARDNYTAEEGQKFINDQDEIKLFLNYCSNVKNRAIIADISQTLSYVYNGLMGIPSEPFSKTTYGVEIPPVIKNVLLAKYKGKLTRIGSLDINSKVKFEIPNDDLLKEANLSNIVEDKDIELVQINKIF